MAHEILTGAKRQALNDVRIWERTFYGNVLFTATCHREYWKIRASYPAFGVDAIEFDIADVDVAVDSVHLLRQWVLENWPLVNELTSVARQMRFVKRKSSFGEA